MTLLLIPGQAVHPDRHGGLPGGAEQPPGPVPCTHLQVAAAAVHGPAGADHGPQHVQHRRDKAQVRGLQQPHLQVL